MEPLTVCLQTELGEVSLCDADILNPAEYVPPGEYNPYGLKPWAIGNEYGLLVVVLANNEQDALDLAADADRLKIQALSEEDLAERTDADGNEEGVIRLGNASEPYDSEDLWIAALPVPPFSLCALYAEQQRQNPAT
jgi:hypothetical protein